MYKNNPEEAKILIGIRQRCYNPKAKGYKNYGGRGIKVCDRWMEPNATFLFVEDLGKRPSKNHSVERINSDGDYSPENCKWATRKEQNNNTRRNVKIKAFGKTLNITQWSVIYGVPYLVIKYRIIRGWDSEKAVSEPQKKKIMLSKYDKDRIIDFYNKNNFTIKEVSDVFNLPLRTTQNVINNRNNP